MFLALISSVMYTTQNDGVF